MMSNDLTILNRVSALTETTRYRLLRLLEQQELTVAELCAILQLPQSTVSRHLKVLSSENWVMSRREGTSNLYHMTLDDLDPALRRLWVLIRDSIGDTSAIQEDEERLQQALRERQTQSQAFFATSAGQWDKMRESMFGHRFDALAMSGLCQANWVVGDLGCGTGQISEHLAPFCHAVIAIDANSEMLKSARGRLSRFPNVSVKRGKLEKLPLEDEELDLAVNMLVLHHLADPAGVLRECARVLKVGGRLLLVDMVRHDRAEYRQQMGHVWLGFEEEQLNQWCYDAGLKNFRYAPMATETNTNGPRLFVATADRAGN